MSKYKLLSIILAAALSFSTIACDFIDDIDEATTEENVTNQETDDLATGEVADASKEDVEADDIKETDEKDEKSEEDEKEPESEDAEKSEEIIDENSESEEQAEEEKEQSKGQEETSAKDQQVEGQVVEQPAVEQAVVEQSVESVRHTEFMVNYIDSFSTLDLAGNTVTNSIFANKEYTMINVWGTFCSPCIREMPELQSIYASMPSNFQMIGIVCDVYTYSQESKDDALYIINKTGVTYPNLMMSDELDAYLASVQYVPATIVVDSKGNVVTEVIVGADTEGYKKIIRQFGK